MFQTLRSETEARWDEFCAQSDDAWFMHTSAYLRYQEIYRPAAGTQPLHFFVERDRQIVGLCPLALERIQTEAGDIRVFALGHDALPAPVVSQSLLRADYERVLKSIFSEISELAKRHDVQKISFRQPSLIARILSPSIAPVNPLIRFGYHEAGIQTRIIDLRPPLDQLWSEVRKSYHSPIHRMQEHFQIQFYDASTITPEAFDAYRLLHHKAAGRVTRPLETFKRMLQWIQNGKGALVLIRDGEKVCGTALVVTYKDRAYYASAANDPDYEKEWPLGHLIQWTLIRVLKERGVTHYETGWQLYGAQMAIVPTLEDQRISFFKSGFGGQTVPVFQGHFYRDPSLFDKEYRQQVQRVAERLQEDQVEPTVLPPTAKSL